MNAADKMNRLIISYKISSEIFSFNTMIESCRSFLFSLGYTEISSIYIVLRELVFNTIIHSVKNSDGAEFECSLQYMGKDNFKIVMQNNEGLSKNECFGWISRDSDNSNLDRGNMLLNRIADSIDLDTENNSVTVFVTLIKI